MTLQTYKLDDPTGEPPHEWLVRACEVLESGRLVALPTETVYGLAARADDPAALARLAEIKGRPTDIAWTWHVGTSDALERFPRLSPAARRLAERYWPGPLTMVLPTVPPGLELAARDGWTGVRYTAEPFARALCAHADFPLVMTSANIHGNPAAVEATELTELDPSMLGLVVDGGRTRLQEASTIVKLGHGEFTLLREGLHDLAALQRTAGRRIGFACTGNTCRSPMAEGLARQLLAERLECAPERISEHGFHVCSMGVFASPGAPAANHAISTLARRGIDISGHRSSPALLEVITELDEVYCLTQSHLAALTMILPPSKAGNLQLLDPEQRDIPDPIGGSAADYQRCAQSIAEALEHRARTWA